ncbi:MAG: DUF2853 family protein [Saprospiraceae bacterium]
MATFEETVKVFEAEMDKLGIHYQQELFHAVTKSIGPSIYLNDASKVSCSQQSELDTVKNNFLIGKLGLEDSPALDEAMKEVCSAMGTSNPNKYRACFYYMLVAKFNKEDMFQ